MRMRLKEENEQNLLDSVKSLMELRLQKGNNEIIEDFIETNRNDNLIVSKDYYDINDFSDDSSDESVKVNQLVCEINSNSENGSADKLEKSTIDAIENNNIQLFETCNSKDNVNSLCVNNSSTESIKSCSENEFIIKKSNDYNQPNENINNVIKNNKLFCDNSFVMFKNQDINEKQSSVENNSKNENTCKDQDINEKQSIENNSKDEKTSQILCDERQYCSLEIIPDANDEFCLSVTQPDQKKIEDISIVLPWKQSNLNEENIIKKSFE